MCRWRQRLLDAWNRNHPNNSEPAGDLADTFCSYCTDHPGYHSARIVGLDNIGRPILYLSILECEQTFFTPEDTEAHYPALFEQAMRLMRATGDDEGFLWVIDCAGFGLGTFSMNHSQHFVAMMYDHYPGLFTKVFTARAPFLYMSFWYAVRAFASEEMRSQVAFVRDENGLAAEIPGAFPEDGIGWFRTEFRLNTVGNTPDSQKRFWVPRKTPQDGSDAHDARGFPSFVKSHIEPCLRDGPTVSQTVAAGERERRRRAVSPPW